MLSGVAVDPADFTPEAIAKIAPACAYCGKPAAFVSGRVIYPTRHDLYDKWSWYCAADAAWVGVHKGTLKPLGRLANAELRRAKIAAHAAFDPLLEKRHRLDGGTYNKARAKGYKWLAAQLGIPGKDCHIGMFDAAMCRRVVEVCRSSAGV